jgi:exodeoxyribonuclease V alpha subunit
VAATWAEQRHIREVMAALQGFGVSTSLAVRIYKRFGDQSGRVVSQEPYRLAREVWGIGFKTADKIAQAVGIAADAPARLEAGVLHALGAAADEGHTLLPEADLAQHAAELLGVDAPAVTAAMDRLLGTGEVVAGTRTGADGHLIALAPFARAEAGQAGRLRSLAQSAENAPVGRVFRDVNWAAAFGWLEDRHQIRLAPEQQAAVRMALTTPVSILTGGPGTGKTHTLRAVLALAQAKRLRCLLAAPTGRAAKRMEEATGLPALNVQSKFPKVLFVSSKRACRAAPVG